MHAMFCIFEKVFDQSGLQIDESGQVKDTRKRANVLQREAPPAAGGGDVHAQRSGLLPPGAICAGIVREIWGRKTADHQPVKSVPTSSP
jgi:hypothetical protein